MQIKLTVYTALFVALISVGAFIAIPIGPVPIVLQNMFVLLAGLILGPVWGVACVAVYLIIGLAGFPVFAGGTSGLGKLFGPTGGYLIAYLPAVYVTGLTARRLGGKRVWDICAMAIGSIIVYAIGVPWLKIAFSLTWTKALAVGLTPFLIGDALKITAGGLMAKKLRTMVKL